jgi:putative ABC transport system ATP-binding protein
VSAEPLIECRSLSKAYVTPSGSVEALHEVDAAFAAGEITAVVGPSGSGKSTLLRALAGLDRPSGGSLLVGADDLAGASPARLRRHRRVTATFVNQKPADNFVPHLTVAEHSESAPAARRLLDEFGLGHRLASTPIELSGGEQARAAFAFALARGTPLIVSDEPTAELDRDSAARLLAAVRRHSGEGAAFVIATHDLDMIAAADRVLLLDRGRVVEALEEARPPRKGVGGGGEVVATARDLEKRFGHRGEDVYALRGASLDLRRGEVGALIGRSGSGKSTLLMLLAGFLTPDAGEIDVGGARPGALPWATLAFLPQRFGLFPELSVRENVELPARLAGCLDERVAAVDALLAGLGLDELAGRLPHETSIGQQQRTALARGLVLSPAVLLVDEPTSHQDAGWRDRVWALLEGAAAAGTSCLVATHEGTVRGYASRVWEIESGAITVASTYGAPAAS